VTILILLIEGRAFTTKNTKDTEKEIRIFLSIRSKPQTRMFLFHVRLPERSRISGGFTAGAGYRQCMTGGSNSPFAGFHPIFSTLALIVHPPFWNHSIGGTGLPAPGCSPALPGRTTKVKVTNPCLPI
jgi:hypothetical protein